MSPAGGRDSTRLERGHIQVDQTATGKRVSSWWKCVRCHKELFDGREIAAGLHFRCRKQVSPIEAERLRESARVADRAQYRRDEQEGRGP